MIVIIGFMVMMIGFVFVSMNQTNPMIEENYYEQELKFQKKIDASNAAATLSGKLSVEKEGNDLVIKLASSELGFIQDGSVKFIHVQNPAFDFEISLKDAQEGVIKVPTATLNSGKYIFKSNFVKESINYYTEGTILL
ncbi:MAG: hypothetical protein HOP11_13410 [Saprospiraceae bacterium]|nr:hypothetical protein [Saprospiraceae bacterium]